MDRNILSPDTQISASPIHSAVEVKIQLSPDPEDGDVYQTGNRANLPSDWPRRAGFTQEQMQRWAKHYDGATMVTVVALTNNALFKIFNAIDAEIVDNSRADLRNVPHYCEWNFSLRYTKPDGSQGMLVGDYALDLRLPENVDGGGARYSDLFESNRDKLIADQAKANGIKYNRSTHKRWDDFLEICWVGFSDEEREKIEAAAAYRARRAVIKMRPHLISRCQTGARNRALRSIGVKSSYFPHELEAPLVVRRVKFDWDKAASMLGKDETKALMLALVEKQMAIPAREVLSLLAPAKEPEKEEDVIEGEITEAEPEPQDEEPEPSPTVDSQDQSNAQSVLEMSDFAMPSAKLISMMGGQGELGKFLAGIAGKLELAGFDTEEKRADLLKELFGTSIISRYQAGWFRLLQAYSENVQPGMAEEELDRLVGIVRAGVLGSNDWDAAGEAYDAQDAEPEELPL